MELSAVQGQEISIAGTGCPTTGTAAGTTPGIAPGETANDRVTAPPHCRTKIVIGLGIFAPVMGAAARADSAGPESPGGSGEETGTGPEPEEKEDASPADGDLIFSLFERQERIADRINRKIARLERRLDRLEEMRGREE